MAIVVGVDGSGQSREALRWALEEARLRGTGVHVVHAWSLPIGGVSPGLGASFDAELLDGLRRDAEQLVERVLADVADAGVELESSVAEGPAAPALVEAADGADLLVVGSRGHGGFAGLLLGSVSQQAAHHAPCPVVIVRGAGG